MAKHNCIMTEDQEALQQMVRSFVEKEIIPNAGEWDKKGEYDSKVFKMATDMGLHMLNIPEEFGGMGMDCLTSCIIREELGRGDAGINNALSASMLAWTPVLVGGTDAQKQMFADILAPGNLASFCLTEPSGGSDAGRMRTTARREGDEYVLNGTKTFITNGGVAKVYTVFAVTTPGIGHKGISAFIVEADRPGISIGKEEIKMGLHSSNTAEVVFTDVRIPADHLLGEENKGYKICMETLDRTRLSVASAAVGLAQRALDECIKYSKERVVFGKPICQHQAIAFMMAEMEMKIQAGRQLVHHAARLVDQGIIDPVVISCAKAFTTDSCMQIATDAVQIFGGYGYSSEYPLEKLMRDAKIFQIFEGTSQIQRVIISSGLLR